MNGNLDEQCSIYGLVIVWTTFDIAFHRKLEEQLRELREAKAELEEQQGELQKMMTQLEEAKNLEAEERRRQEEEIRAKAQEIEEIRAVVEAKERETEELQQEVDVSKQKLEVTFNLKLRMLIFQMQETAQSLAASMAIAQEAQQRAEVAGKFRSAETVN